MATLTVKNVPNDLYEKLKVVATANRRSINSEVITIIERAIEHQTENPYAVQARVRQLREKLDIYVTEEEINAAKNEGRP